jgi:hypothetical protein
MGVADSFRARNLKDCYQVSLHETITYRDGCSSDVNADYDVVIGKTSVLPAQNDEKTFKNVLQNETTIRVCGKGRVDRKSWEIIKSGDDHAALPHLHALVRAVFKRDEGLFFTNAEGGTFLPGKTQSDILTFDFCRAHMCTEEESVLFIDTKTGSAAGAIIHEGKMYPYIGDYASQDDWPQPVKQWWKEHTG